MLLATKTSFDLLHNIIFVKSYNFCIIIMIISISIIISIIIFVYSGGQYVWYLGLQ